MLRGEQQGVPRADLALGPVIEALRVAGFTNVAAFSVAPSTVNPEEVRPLGRWDRWVSPAFLVTGCKDRVAGASVLESIIQAVDRAQSAGQVALSGRLLRVTNSTRGKSIAFIESSGARVVVRIARSATMLADEARSFEVLERAHANPAIATRVPRPLVADSIGGISFFAQSHLSGVPLSSSITGDNRAAYLHEADAFLRALNPDLAESPASSVDDVPGPEVGQPMAEFVLKHVVDSSLRARARSMIDESLRGATSRLGIVHGDFGTGNILVAGSRISGIIDWEAARCGAPPVLDALNYLDSVHRTCNKGLSIVDTLPMLAEGEWPIPGELDFLRESFRRSGVDFKFRKGFALMYFLFHIGPQLRFASEEEGPSRRLEQVLRRMVER